MIFLIHEKETANRIKTYIRSKQARSFRGTVSFLCPAYPALDRRMEARRKNLTHNQEWIRFGWEHDPLWFAEQVSKLPFEALQYVVDATPENLSLEKIGHLEAAIEKWRIFVWTSFESWFIDKENKPYYMPRPVQSFEFSQHTITLGAITPMDYFTLNRTPLILKFLTDALISDWCTPSRIYKSSLCEGTRKLLPDFDVENFIRLSNSIFEKMDAFIQEWFYFDELKAVLLEQKSFILKHQDRVSTEISDTFRDFMIQIDRCLQTIDRREKEVHFNLNPSQRFSVALLSDEAAREAVNVLYHPPTYRK